MNVMMPMATGTATKNVAIPVVIATFMADPASRQRRRSWRRAAEAGQRARRMEG
jgi:hypothetical protein